MSKKTKSIIGYIALIAVLITIVVLIWMYAPAIKGAIDNERYYTPEEVEQIKEKHNQEKADMQEQIDYFKSQVDNYLKSIEVYKTQVADLTKSLNEALTENGLDKETISKLMDKIDKLNTEIDSLNKKLKLYEEILEAYEDSDKLRVTFYIVQNGEQTPYDVQVVEPNGYLAEVVTPEGNFEGWTMEIGGEYIDDLTTIQVTENITIYGIFSNTVTFVIQDQEPTTQVVSYNGYATHEDVNIIGYTFKGWSLDKTNVINLNETPITKDTTFYAVFEEKLYSIQEFETVKDQVTEFYIFEPNDLVELSNLVTGGEYFDGYTILLANDIDMQSINFTAIASVNSNDTFSGNFDGQNYKIKNLTSQKGLFNRVSQIKSGESYSISISNLFMENINFGSSSYIGGIVNTCNGSVTITNCHVTGAINSEIFSAGIVANAGMSGTIKIDKCNSSVNITTKGNSGGIVGQSNTSLEISNSYNSGNITDTFSGYIGGLVGKADTSLKISNSYNSGNLSAHGYIGGLVGMGNNVQIVNSFNVGTVENTNEFTSTYGSLVGYGSGNISNCYYADSMKITDSSNIITSNVEQETTNNLKQLSFYTDSSNWHIASPWDMNNVWTIVENNYPTLR